MQIQPISLDMLAIFVLFFSDVVLQDFCNIVGRQNLDVPTPHQRAWFRNVFTEPVGTVGQCVDPTEPLVPRATECVALPATYCESNGADAPDGSGEVPNGSGEASSASNIHLLATFFALVGTLASVV